MDELMSHEPERVANNVKLIRQLADHASSRANTVSSGCAMPRRSEATNRAAGDLGEAKSRLGVTTTPDKSGQAVTTASAEVSAEAEQLT